MPPVPIASDRPADALFHVMRSRFDVAVEELCVGAHHFRIASVRQPEILLDAIAPAEFAVDERLPYWAELWTSALVLAEKILSDDAVAGLSVLELGCGLGLAGIAAAKAGAHVTLTDYDEDALMFARWNALTNLGASTAGRIRICSMDWRQAPGDRYDMVLGADIVYERRHIAPLLAFFAAAVKPGGRALLGEPDRRIGDDFLTQARERGFQIAMDHVPVQRRGRASTVRLITLRPDTR